MLGVQNMITPEMRAALAPSPSLAERSQVAMTWPVNRSKSVLGRTSNPQMRQAVWRSIFGPSSTIPLGVDALTGGGS